MRCAAPPFAFGLRPSLVYWNAEDGWGGFEAATRYARDPAGLPAPKWPGGSVETMDDPPRDLDGYPYRVRLDRGDPRRTSQRAPSARPRPARVALAALGRHDAAPPARPALAGSFAAPRVAGAAERLTEPG